MLLLLNTAATSESIYHRCLRRVKEIVQDLGLSGIASNKVLMRKMPWTSDFLQTVGALPCVLVCPYGRISVAGATNRRDDIGYPIAVVTIQRSADSSNANRLTANFNRHLTWRQKISRAFRHGRLDGVNEVWTTREEPDQTIGQQAFSDGFDAQATIFRFIAREERGTT